MHTASFGMQGELVTYCFADDCLDLLAEIDSNSQDYKSNVKKLEKEERKDKLSKIQELFQKAREYSDDKVQIAMQMYEMVSISETQRVDGNYTQGFFLGGGGGFLAAMIAHKS